MSNKSQFEGIEKNTTTWSSNQVTILKRSIYKTVQTDVLNRISLLFIHLQQTNKTNSKKANIKMKLIPEEIGILSS